MLSKNIRTHILILNDWREINITKEQYSTIRLRSEDAKYSDPLTIKDIDNGEIVYDGKMWAIKEFSERKQDNTLQSKQWICSYWWRHPVSWFPNNCDCRKKFKVLPCVFIDKLKDMWYKLDFDYQITNEMRDNFLKENYESN